MNRTLIIFLALVACGSLATMAWMMGTPAPADPRLAALQAENETLKKEVGRLKEQLAHRAALAAAPKPSAPATSARPEVGADLAADAAKNSNPAADLREMMTSPGMRAMMEQQQSMQIDAGYGKLMVLLQLNDEEKAHFKKLLLEREKYQTEMGLKLLDASLTPEQRKKISDDLVAQRGKFDETIRAFLNDNKDYATFQQWEETQPERIQFDMMGRTLFSSSNQPLSEQQEEQLFNLMANARKGPTAPANILDPGQSDPTQITEQRIAEYIRGLEASHGKLVQQAAGMLSPEQLKIFEAYLGQARDMARTGASTFGAMVKGAPR